MLWVKAFHIVAMVCWFAGLFYLPRLFVYHSMAEDQVSKDRFKIMESKLYKGIATPAMAATIVLGIWLLSYNFEFYLNSIWFYLKLLFVAVLIWYHLYCGKLLKVFAEDNNQRNHVFYRWFNEFPVLLLIIIVVLVIVKPF